MWRETTLLTDRAVQLATAKTYVISDSVRCLGSISDEPVKAWESRIRWLLETRYLKELDRIDRENRLNSSGQNFIGFTSLGFFTEIQKMMAELRCELEQFQRKYHLHVHGERHYMWNSRKWKKTYCEFLKRCNIR